MCTSHDEKYEMGRNIFLQHIRTVWLDEVQQHLSEVLVPKGWSLMSVIGDTEALANFSFV